MSAEKYTPTFLETTTLSAALGLPVRIDALQKLGEEKGFLGIVLLARVVPLDEKALDDIGALPHGTQQLFRSGAVAHVILKRTIAEDHEAYHFVQDGNLHAREISFYEFLNSCVGVDAIPSKREGRPLAIQRARNSVPSYFASHIGEQREGFLLLQDCSPANTVLISRGLRHEEVSQVNIFSYRLHASDRRVVNRMKTASKQ